MKSRYRRAARWCKRGGLLESLALAADATRQARQRQGRRPRPEVEEVEPEPVEPAHPDTGQVGPT
jgi:hypothetical protein